MNHIFSMISLTIMGMNPGLLVRKLFLFDLVNLLVMLTIPLVVFLAWVLAFFFQLEYSQLVTLICWLCLYQKESSPKAVVS